VILVSLSFCTIDVCILAQLYPKMSDTSGIGHCLLSVPLLSADLIVHLRSGAVEPHAVCSLPFAGKG
jgi:hypothetical protein